MPRNAKPSETLLKLKQIKPDIEFFGADKKVYDEFLEAQAELNLLSTLKKRKKNTRKVKQTIPREEVVTGELEINEATDTETEESV